MVEKDERDFESLSRKELDGEKLIVPRGLLACCIGVLVECDKHMPITGSNFNDDLRLCILQLTEFLV